MKKIAAALLAIAALGVTAQSAAADVPNPHYSGDQLRPEEAVHL
jgi:hypothetical protein